MIRLAVNGALGRMGSRILALAAQSPEFEIAGAYERAKHPRLGEDIRKGLGQSKGTAIPLLEMKAASLKKVQVLIDFSSPEGVAASLEAALKTKTPLVIGTTAVGSQTETRISAAAKTIPVLFSPNMSMGANFLFELAKLSAAKLKGGYDIEIIEAHHRLKVDAPSGTARKLAEVVAKARGWDLAKAGRYGRQGNTGQRPKEEIGIHVIRAGDIVGDHTILFSGPGETLELKHHAQSRDAFARGALAAAVFLSKQAKGFYTMADVLGLRESA